MSDAPSSRPPFLSLTVILALAIAGQPTLVQVRFRSHHLYSLHARFSVPCSAPLWAGQWARWAPQEGRLALLSHWWFIGCWSRGARIWAWVQGCSGRSRLRDGGELTSRGSLGCACVSVRFRRCGRYMLPVRSGGIDETKEPMDAADFAA